MKKFTLIELLIVVALIGILLSMLLPSLHKARKGAKTAVCMSNLKQIHPATTLYLKNNKQKYPRYTGGSSTSFAGYKFVGNSGIKWGGGADSATAGYRNVTLRPVNTYLGHNSNQDYVSEANCPFEGTIGMNWSTRVGSSYMAAARYTPPQYGGDYDLDNSFLFTIRRPNTMVFMTGAGAWHRATNQAIKWQSNNHGANDYPLSFVDGHTAKHKVLPGLGINLNTNLFDIENKPD
ncbi:MAG: type II secretion system protein [Lentisphaeraceae bacterium]|nr:type II secretion system protein [Lentisphaeraceae bacterium]